MGLDGVELIMKLEERFDIEISKSDAMKIKTVGDIYNCVLLATEGRRSAYCYSRELFFRLRKAFMKVLSTPWERIKPSTKIDSLIPLENCEFYIRKLESESGLEFIDIEWINKNSESNGALDFLVLTVLTLLFEPLIPLDFGLLSFFAAFIVSSLFFLFVLVPIGKKVMKGLSLDFRPYEYKSKTIRDLVYTVRDKNNSYPDRGLNKNQKWEEIRKILIEVLGVDEESISYYTNLHDDLGVD